MLNLSSISAMRPDGLPGVQVPGLYVHVPFCVHKCHYCDFYSIPGQSSGRMEQFVDLVLHEADAWMAAPRVVPQTIFIGGGTPTVLPLEHMRRLIEGLRHRFDLSNVQEWTIEANPATVTLEYCRMLRHSGVDRLSFGAQSFNVAELRTLQRRHAPEDVPRSIEIAREAGFTRLSLDLIFAIPGQSLDSWSQSLEQAIALRTPHLSCYGLTYEPNTPLGVKRGLGKVQPAEESLELKMLHHTRQRLSAAGIFPYEISNYAIPGEECGHNLLYWHGEDYIGLGPSAASHVQGTRWRNRPHLGEWEQAVSAGQLPAIDVENLSPVHRAAELVFLMLRLERGLNFNDFAARSGFDARTLYAGPITRLCDAGLLIVDSRGMRLSNTGLNVADSVAAEFLATVPDESA